MKKKLLLHVCCGPCSLMVMRELMQSHDVTVYFFNPNIYPLEEYEKRKKEVIKLCEENSIVFVDADYDPSEWFSLTEEYKDAPEGGARCKICYKYRLEESVRFGKENGFPIFATTLTSSRNKKASVVNAIAKDLAEAYGIDFYEEDWKKKGRLDNAMIEVRERGIYWQEFCGCVYSKISNSPNF